MARILIDGRFIGIGDSVSRYTLEVVKGVMALDQENQYTLAVRPQGESEVYHALGKELPKNLKLKVLDIPHYTLSEQTKFLKFLNQERFDLVHFTQFNHPAFYRGKFIITIHDLTMFGHLHRQSMTKRFAFNRVMRSGVKNSVKILTVSKTSKKEIVEYYRVDPKKISITYNAVDHKYDAKLRYQTSKIEAFKQKYGITGNYLLYTGMWKRHKNLMRMFSAFERYIAEKDIEKLDLQLVLVGKPDPKEPEVMTEINRMNNSHKYKSAGKKVFVSTGFVEEEELPIAYAGALAYIIPSLSEGFGLPPLEAMACGTPVISSHESCMPEILGEAAFYFNPYDINDIKRAIEKILNDRSLREQLAKKGLEQVKKYDWLTTAEKTLKVYKEALRN